MQREGRMQTARIEDGNRETSNPLARDGGA